jgi:hypothetical protein
MKETAKDVISSLELYLNPDVFRREEALRSAREALAGGRLVVIRNAMREAFAERMFQCLDAASDWRVYEKYQDHFHYHHHNLFERKLFPTDLAWCGAIFASEPTRNFMQRLSGRDCSGETDVSASWYLPGDHSLPHSDYVENGDGDTRQLAFVWHLTRNWHPTWGGDFFWCPASRYLSPTFNTLLLFTVGWESYHFVTHVSPYARSKRLAVNGWWTGKRQSIAAPRQRQPPAGGGPVVEVI